MDAISDLKWLIVVMIIIWVVWFFTGGPSREISQGGPFLKEPPPLDTGETYGELTEIRERSQNQDSEETSIFKDEVSIINTLGANGVDPSTEYIEIFASPGNISSVNITGWTLRNSSGQSVSIPRASKTPRSGAVNIESSLLLAPGERALITTGRSPIGVSFQINSCSGYFEQFQNFTPPLARSCPHPVTGARSSGRLEEDCINYIQTLPTCQIVLGSIPAGLGGVCTDYVGGQINYNQCINDHQRDAFFHKGEWRVYLKESLEFWPGQNGLVRLYDSRGNLVDSRAY